MNPNSIFVSNIIIKIYSLALAVHSKKEKTKNS